MSNWVGGLPPTSKSTEDAKKVKKEARPHNPVDDDHPRIFFGGAIPSTSPKMPKIFPEDLKPPKVTFVGGPPIVSKAPPSPPPPPSLPPPPPLPPPPSPISPWESEPTSLPYSPSTPMLPTRLPLVFDKKSKKKKKKKKKKKPPPPSKYEVEEEEEEEERKFGTSLKLPSIFAISHIPATRQGYPQDTYVYEKEDRFGATSPRSRDSDDGPNIPPEVPSYKRGNAFAAIWGKLIDVRNIIKVGPHGWHPKSNASYDVTNDGETITVSPSGWHEVRSE